VNSGSDGDGDPGFQFDAADKLVQQRLRASEVRRVEAFGEPAVDVVENVPRLLAASSFGYRSRNALVSRPDLGAAAS
jgi:hypothetical protein